MSFDGSFELMGQKQQAAWKKFGNPVFGPASSLTVVHEIILDDVDAVFGTIKKMHGNHIRCRKRENQDSEIAMRIICCNIKLGVRS